jgi:hypothetical protein
MSKLWDYLSGQHRLTLTESELHDILWLAKDEIELPDLEEIKEYSDNEFNSAKSLGQEGADMYALGVAVGINWALNKVRNPYPRNIKFIKAGTGGETMYDRDKIRYDSCP